VCTHAYTRVYTLTHSPLSKDIPSSRVRMLNLMPSSSTSAHRMSALSPESPARRTPRIRVAAVAASSGSVLPPIAGREAGRQGTGQPINCPRRIYIYIIYRYIVI
jgi:hypothetical protein